MSLQTAADVPLLITSENASTERRITPSWTIGQLKAKLEAVTGIPPLSQKLSMKHGGQNVAIEAVDEENTQLASFPLTPYAEIHVSLMFGDRDLRGFARRNGRCVIQGTNDVSQHVREAAPSRTFCRHRK